MGIRIKSKSDKFTVNDLSQFLYHLDNIYKAEVFLLQGKEYNISNFYGMKLKDSESLFVGPISKQSPFDITLVPTVTDGEIASILLGIIQTIISVTRQKDKSKQHNDKKENETKNMIQIEFERRDIEHNDVIREEALKITFLNIKIEDVELVNKTFRDYFKEEVSK